MTNDEKLMRLQRFLARGGVASRRKCEELIASGHVKVNGCTVTEMGAKVDPKKDIVDFDGRRIFLPLENLVIALNKPVGYLSAMHDERTNQVVSALVPVDKYPGLFPLGRLDKDTSGLLLFATDGDLGHALMHPSKGVNKQYVALIDGELSEADIFKLESGIELDDEGDGGGLTAPAKCEILKDSSYPDICLTPKQRSRKIHTQKVLLEIHEGRNRQVRRMFKALGFEVLQLKRISVGPIALGNLELGKYRELDNSEVSALYAACGRK